MSHCIIKMHNYYFEYSSVVNAPITEGMSLDDFKKYYKEEYGNRGIEYLEKVLSKLQDKDMFSTWGPLDDILEYNGAGPEETCLTLEEIYKAYCLKEPILDNWLPEELL